MINKKIILIPIILTILLSAGVFAITFPVNETTNITSYANADVNTLWNGWEITTNVSNMTITSVTIATNSNAQIIAIVNSSGFTICAFQTANQVNCPLPYVGVYYVVSGNNGSTYTRAFGETPTQSMNISLNVTKITGSIIDWNISSTAPGSNEGIPSVGAGTRSSLNLRNLLAITFNGTNNQFVSPTISIIKPTNNHFHLNDKIYYQNHIKCILIILDIIFLNFHQMLIQY